MNISNLSFFVRFKTLKIWSTDPMEGSGDLECYRTYALFPFVSLISRKDSHPDKISSSHQLLTASKVREDWQRYTLVPWGSLMPTETLQEIMGLEDDFICLYNPPLMRYFFDKKVVPLINSSKRWLLMAINERLSLKVQFLQRKEESITRRTLWNYTFSER